MSDSHQQGKRIAGYLALIILAIMIWLLSYQPPELVVNDKMVEPPLTIIIGPVEKMPEVTPQFTFQSG